MPRQLILATAFLAATTAQAANFTLSSPDIKAGAMIDRKFEFNGFGCSARYGRAT